MSEFYGKHVLITGGTRGIGLAAAEAFAKEGAVVSICGVSQKNLDQALEQLWTISPHVSGMTCNVGNAKELDALAQNSFEQFGPIHVWVNNAGFMPNAPLAKTDTELFDKLFRTNVFPICKTAEYANRYIPKGGVIINASSFTAKIPSTNYGGYAASKAAVISMTQALAAELAPHSIRVTGYMPGLIDTELSRESIEKNGSAIFEPIPLRRAGNAEEIANVIVFLASEKASYINGVCVEISGGKYATQNPWVAWK